MGQETHGTNWQADWVDDAEAPEREMVLKYLYAALQSGDVTAHWSTLDFRHTGDLSPQEADREFFSIRLHDNTVFHHSMNQPVICRIHKEQLRRFAKGQGCRIVSATRLAIGECFSWLVEQFSDSNFRPPPMQDHMDQAKALFPRLSNAGYKEARRRAIEATERTDLMKPGRRPKSNQSAN